MRVCECVSHVSGPAWWPLSLILIYNRGGSRGFAGPGPRDTERSHKLVLTQRSERARMCPLFNTPGVTRPQKQNLHGLRARHCAASFVLCRVMRK